MLLLTHTMTQNHHGTDLVACITSLPEGCLLKTGHTIMDISDRLQEEAILIVCDSFLTYIPLQEETDHLKMCHSSSIWERQ
jgi:hypothetical protein